jgi:ubiquinone/menaquinone biosynthesis C-methylase UbiE
MSFYSNYIFPRLMDAALSGKELQEIRKTVLSQVEGEIFEIGFGTGLNLPHYPARVKRITTVDPNPGARRIAQRRIDQSGIEVVHLTLGGEKLPLDDERFDSIVCTFTLCSIQEVHKALGEMRRILKPEGRFHFVEHGLADDPGVQWWQQKLTPLQRRIGDGCHLNRDAAKLLRQNGFQVEQLENFYLKGVPRFGGYLYQGIASKL